MHSNIWATLYLAIVPSVLFLLIGLILRLAKKRFVNLFLFIGVGLLLFPIIFILAHFASEKEEMNLRTGSYFVTRQENLDELCKGLRFDTLRLVLKKTGEFEFNYKPCFANQTTGNWKWTDNLVHSYCKFDKISDSLSLDFPFENIPDTLILTNYKKTFLTFAKSK